MASNINKNIIRLQRALNDKDQRILYSTSQFYSAEQKRAITKHTIKQALEKDEETGKYNTITLFSSYSQLQIVLFLRDLWFQANGWELPTDNPVWEGIKKEQKLFEYAERDGS